MPRFWNYVDAEAWLKAQKAQHAAYHAEEDMQIDHEHGPSTTNANGESIPGSKGLAQHAGFFANMGKDHQSRREEAAGGGNEVKAKPMMNLPRMPAAAVRAPESKKTSDVGKGAGFKPEKAALQQQQKGAAAASGGVGARAPQRERTYARVIAGDESEDDESLPEIDSGASSSDDEED